MRASTRCLVIALGLTLGACSSVRRDGLMFEVFPETEDEVRKRLDQGQREEPAEQLLRVAEISKRQRKALRVELTEVTAAMVAAQWERPPSPKIAQEHGELLEPLPPPEGVDFSDYAELGFFESFPSDPEGESAGDLATGACATAFCAGVAAGTLNPEAWSLPDRPSGLLRLLTGKSEPPLAGWGGRFRSGGLGLGAILRVIFRRHYASHLFKDYHAPMSGLPIQVKTLILRDADGKILYWVKTDLVGAFHDLRKSVLKALHEQHQITDIGDDNFLFHATHTHSGLGAISPRIFGMLATVDLFDRPVYDALVGEIVGTILAARETLVPAQLGTGSATIDWVTKNRRKQCGGGPSDDPAPDPTVGIVRIDHLNGDRLATVFSFSIHGTSLGAGNMRLHPDNMGYAERYIEQEQGGMALFFNGAEGDVGPVGHAADIGGAVGCVVVDRLDALFDPIHTTPDVKLASEYCTLEDGSFTDCGRTLEPLQFRPLMFIERPKGSGCYADTGDSSIVLKVPKHKDPPLMDRLGAVFAAFRIDQDFGGGMEKNTLLLTLPAEPITELGMQIRSHLPQDSGFEEVWIVGLANAHMGYVVTEKEYLQGGYESGSNFFGKTQGAVFRDIAVDLATTLVVP